MKVCFVVGALAVGWILLAHSAALAADARAGMDEHASITMPFTTSAMLAAAQTPSDLIQFTPTPAPRLSSQELCHFRVQSTFDPRITVVAGDNVVLASNWHVYVPPYGRYVEANGNVYPPDQTFSAPRVSRDLYLDPRFKLGSLLCKIRPESRWMSCADRMSFNVLGSGRLLFAVNLAHPAVGDHASSFMAIVEIKHRVPRRAVFGQSSKYCIVT